MPYTSIPTFVDGSVLTASALNTLSSNVSFLYGVANQANIPFNSFRGIRVTMDQADAVWDIQHAVTFLHWKVISLGGNWNYARLYYNGVKVGEGPASTGWTGAYNLASWAGLPNLKGAWASGVAYEDDVNGDGNAGNSDDGAVVTQGGQYYRCKRGQAHTSSAATQPGIGASWTAYWDLLTLPTVGTMCVVWVDVNFNSGQEMGVEYIVETDSASPLS